MKKFLLMGALVIVALPTSTQAQNLQNSQTGLQQQTGQTQNTRALQNQTAPLQTNNPGQLLTQSQVRSLNVVSNPSQTQPDVTVGASSTTNAPGQVSDRTSLWRNLLIASLAGLAISLLFYLRNKSINTSVFTDESTPLETVSEPKVSKPKQKKSSKKKKKAHHR